MILWCAKCGKETDHDEMFEDRFDPGSMYGHYQVSAGMVCLVCGKEFEVEEVDYGEGEDSTP